LVDLFGYMMMHGLTNPKRTRKAINRQSNIVKRSRNHYCCRKAKSIIYAEYGVLHL